MVTRISVGDAIVLDHDATVMSFPVFCGHVSAGEESFEVCVYPERVTTRLDPEYERHLVASINRVTAEFRSVLLSQQARLQSLICSVSPRVPEDMVTFISSLHLARVLVPPPISSDGVAFQIASDVWDGHDLEVMLDKEWSFRAMHMDG